MTRTWEDNRAAINQLWPASTFTEEERRLWSDDLSGKDQAILYDAIRNAKRGHDSVYPQLKWVLDEYRELARLRRDALDRKRSPGERKVLITISTDEDRQIAGEFIAWIDEAQPSDYQLIYDAIFATDSFNKTSATTAFRLVEYAKKRLLGIKPQLSRVTRDGGIEPLVMSVPNVEEIVT
jgi:hypothetical protein